MKRRTFNFAVASVPAISLLSACTEKTINGVTTITLNLATFEEYAQAAANGGQMILTFPGVLTLLGPAKEIVIQTAMQDIAQSIAALNTASGGSQTLTFDTTSVPAAVSSIETDIQTILTDATTVSSSLGSSLGSQFTEVFEAIKTVVSLAQVLVSNFAAPETPMTPAQALAILK